jgi:lysophospholipase L1-like esterase
MPADRRALAAVLLAALLLVGGVVAGTLVLLDRGDPDQAVLPVDEATGIDYVALGDSYSAGPLVPENRTDPPGCFRSTNNYPAYLAGHLKVRGYTDVTCSGATTGDFFEGQRLLLGGGRVPAQLDALSDETDLVTVGIGGNDFGLFGSLNSTCGAVAADDSLGAPCRDQFTNARGVDTKARDARAIVVPLSRALAAVRERAPEAEVYVLGYPRILPRGGATCAQAPMAAGDYAWANRIGALLNRSVRLAAEREDMSYVDLAAPSSGHDVCAGRAAWVNGYQAQFGLAADFHPFLRGMRAVAGELYRQITGEQAPANRRAHPPPGSVVENPSA